MLTDEKGDALSFAAPPLAPSAVLPSGAASPILPPPQTVTFFPLQSENLSSGKVPLSSHPTGSLAALTSDSLESIDFSQCIFAKYCLKDFLSYDPAFEFEEKLSRAFLDTYFTRLQFKYPLLDEQEIYSFHDDYISNNVHSYSTKEFHFACGRMWLIFSIAACLQKSGGKYQGLPPNRYFSTAIRHITKCGGNLTYIQQVEVLSLLLLYIIRTDRDSSGLYEIIKDVMSICKNKLFLNKWNEQDMFANKKLRLFWCIYSLERMICVAIGKPYTILESEIDLPFFNENSFNNNSVGDHKRQKKGVHFMNQSLKLRRIESQFVEALQIIPQCPSKTKISHKTTAELEKQLPEVEAYFRELEIWRASCSNGRSFENETLRLYYFRSVRLLIQPYLELLEPENRLFRECQAAAGQICQLYKIVHQKTVNGHSTPAVHTVFVAGVTLIYCMWLTRNLDDERRRKLGDASKHTRPMVSASLFSTMDDLRACSVCLYVMAERSKFAVTFRNTFDELMNATIGNLIERCGPDSSELIHLNGVANDNDMDYALEKGNHSNPLSTGEAGDHRDGMPPAIKRTFGTTSGNGHTVLGGNQSVDPEEQKAMQKKQGDLQKATVPQKLSHLLQKPDESTDVIKQGSHEMSRKPSSYLTDTEKYVVKKPARIAESDWHAFQQQALLQQHHAQQTLQAYLSSLNGKNGDRGGNTHTKQLRKAGLESRELEAGAQSSYSFEKLEVKQNQPAKVDSKALTPQQWSGQFDGTAIENGKAKELPKSPAPDLSRSPALQRPLKTFSPPEPDYSKILFNNGAHAMINNISTWTNDSVIDLMNSCQLEPGFESNSQVESSYGNARVGANDPNWRGDSLEQNAVNAESSVLMPHVPQQLNHQSHPQSNHQTYQQTGQQNLQGLQNQQNQQTSRPLVQPSRGALQSDQAFGTPIEDFWTVNEGYGFLA